MAKISRKIVQAIAGVGKKGLVNLERVHNKIKSINRKKQELEYKAKGFINEKRDNARNYYRYKVNDVETASRNLVDIGVLKTTKALLDKKLISPSQAKRINNVMDISRWDSSPFHYSPQSGKLKTSQIRRKLQDSLPHLSNDFEGKVEILGEKIRQRRNVPKTKTDIENWRKYSKMSRRMYDKNDAIDRLANRYIIARDIALKLGTAGLIGAGVAGAKALSSKEESKNKSSDVKKMANRSNKYFS